MRPIQQLMIIAPLLAAAGCETGGSSTEDVRQAAIEHARAELGLAADAPLEATVWAGQEYEGEITVCGTVSGGNGAAVAPQRFAASTDPIDWLIFEDAHNPIVTSQPDKFPEWSQLCGQEAES